MKRVTGKEMCRILEARGWKLKCVTGSHHFYEHVGKPGVVARFAASALHPAS